MTELIWDGKYKDSKKQGPVRIALPFQTIETVNESAQDRRRNLELFSAGREQEWRNRLIWGDKKYVLPSLLQEFAGKVDLIYIDPPFATGGDFSFTATIPEDPDADGEQATTFVKEPSVIEQKAYRDTWGRGLDGYLKWFFETVVLLRDLLSEDGAMYVHLDHNLCHYAKAVLDEVFGIERFVNEIVWKRQTAKGDVAQGAQHMGRIHETLFLYTKSERYKWNVVHTAYDQSYVESHYPTIEEGTGRRYTLSDLTAAKPGGDTRYEWKGVVPYDGRYWAYSKQNMEEFEREGRLVYSRSGMPRYKRYLDESPGVPLQDLWTDIFPINSQASERLGYPTQKPEALLDRILRTSSDEDDLVLDCFCGSGTTAAVAEKLNRRWIACDLSRFGIHTTRKRLLAIPGVRPFVVQNLGKYERQAWQAAEFPANGENRLEKQRQQEAAYRHFILDLYRAEPLTGHQWLHGTKGGRTVHVGAVDAPVTLADVKAIAKEAWKALGSTPEGPTRAGVDILGWDFAFELNELAKQVAAQSRVAVAFKKIPREVLDNKAVEQGDIRFFELGALSVDTKMRNREVRLKLKDFVIPTDDIPEEARRGIKHWSQLIDYWAVDWDNRNDTFHNEWQTYRSRQEPNIELEASHAYSESGQYTVVVKVIDILGNDTTMTAELAVRDS
jgi:adenine-specific DNA-methyltransferase